MNVDRLHLDGLELRAVAGRIHGGRAAVDDAGAAVRGVSIDQPPDDPLRTHRHFAQALTEFTTAWADELTYLGEAAGDLVVGLNRSAKALFEADRQIGVDVRTQTGIPH